jgi:hypothetical protein
MLLKLYIKIYKVNIDSKKKIGKRKVFNSDPSLY